MARLRHLLARIALRTGRGPLRPLWWALHECLIRSLAAIFRRTGDAAVYVRGSFATREPVFGVSDVDLIVVAAQSGAPGRAHARLRARYEALCRRVPLMARILKHFFVYEREELLQACETTALTARRAVYRGPAPLADEIGLAERPGLYGPGADWRLVAGRDLRPHVPAGDAAARGLAAWLELQFWWRYAFLACSQPGGLFVPFLCLKLVADPLRIWLWLAHGERPADRTEVLERALVLLPEERHAIIGALELGRELTRSPKPPLADALGALLRLTRRIAALVAAEAADAGTTEVRLRRGSPADSGLLPLCDWRALVVASPAWEVLRPAGGSPDDPDGLAAAVAAGGDGVQPVLVGHELLVLPATGFPRTALRAVQCRLTDPVTFALSEGADTASFPNVPGWSAADWARRAVTEHRAWLDPGQGRQVRTDFPPEGGGPRLTAARAALFQESLERGRPELPVDAAATAEMLAEREREGGGALAGWR